MRLIKCLVAVCGALCTVPATAGDTLRAQAAALFGTIESVSEREVDDPLVRLGRALFWDPRLSADGRTACASCHLPEDWGSDRRRFSIEARGQLTRRHSQSVFNTQAATAGLRWLADRPSGADQALGSITGSMGFDTRDDLIAALRDHAYTGEFEKAFPEAEEPLRAEHYATALQAYQQTLRTPAPFDTWLMGDDAALDAGQIRGIKSFIDVGCGGCHAGALFGGGSLQRFGLIEDYRAHTGSAGDDKGLIDTTGQESDRDVFRVQPLRNVSRTAPYFHDGSVADLGDAVAVMAKVQLGQTLSSDMLVDIVRFLDALTGPVPHHYGPPRSE